jgi:hypothetical protein
MVWTQARAVSLSVMPLKRWCSSINGSYSAALFVGGTDRNSASFNDEVA